MKETVQSVVVLGCGRIVLVVVTPRATKAQSQHDLAHCIERVFDDQMHVLQVASAKTFGMRDKTGCNHSLCIFVRWTLPRDDVAGNLLAYELVVRFVIVKSTNNVVSIAPCKRLGPITFIAVRFRKSHEIQPVTSPLFTVVRRVKQLINDSLERLGLETTEQVKLLAQFPLRPEVGRAGDTGRPVALIDGSEAAEAYRELAIDAAAEVGRLAFARNPFKVLG